jgi:Tetratricopeptide repeat
VSPNAGDVSAWGATLGGGDLTARSAVCIDARGNILYADSMSALPSDLANALVSAGAVTAMELDINPNGFRLTRRGRRVAGSALQSRTSIVQRTSTSEFTGVGPAASRRPGWRARWGHSPATESGVHRAGRHAGRGRAPPGERAGSGGRGARAGRHGQVAGGAGVCAPDAQFGSVPGGGVRLCAFLDPDEIDLDVLAAGATETGGVLAAALGDRLERTETAGALARASLVTATAEGRLRVHRLVQAVTRDQLDEDQLTAWSGRALSLVAAVFPSEPEDHRSWPVCARVAPHIEAVAAQTESYPDLGVTRGRLLGEPGIYLFASAQLRAALSVLERSVAINEAAYGSDHPEVAIILTNLGITQRRLGELADARITQERALAIQEAAYGPDHPKVASTLTNLGLVQRQLGDQK